MCRTMVFGNELVIKTVLELKYGLENDSGDVVFHSLPFFKCCSVTYYFIHYHFDSVSPEECPEWSSPEDSPPIFEP